MTDYIITCDGHFLTFRKGLPAWTKTYDQAIVFDLSEAKEFIESHADFFSGLSPKIQDA